MELSRDSDFQTNNIPVNRNKSNNGNFRGSGRTLFKVYKSENYEGLLSLTISLFFSNIKLFARQGGLNLFFVFKDMRINCRRFSMKPIRVLLLIMILEIFSFGADIKYFNPGFKVGMNFTKQSFTHLEPIKYLYPLGFDMGLSNTITFNTHFFLLNDFYFSYTNSMVKYSPAAAVSPCYANYKNNFLRLSSNFGLNVFDELETFIGIDIGYLINSILIIYDTEIGNVGLKENMKGSFPDFDFILDIGINKKFNIRRNTYSFEVKLLKGLTQYHDDIINIDFTNYYLQSNIGIVF